MSIVNQLKIKAWQLKVAGKEPSYVEKTKCPVCGGKLYLRDEEMDKYNTAMINQTVAIAKAHDSKSLTMHLLKHPPGVKIYWMCENYDCEFNGADDGIPEKKAEPDNSKK